MAEAAAAIDEVSDEEWRHNRLVAQLTAQRHRFLAGLDRPSRYEVWQHWCRRPGLAQVFDEFGHGIILRGTPVSIDKKNRHPYLSEDQAHELLRDALDEYDRALEHMPARIVIHKSSLFRESERKGFLRALDEKGIRSKDFVAITDTDIRLFGDKEYPPKRGTLLTISQAEGVLYTRGTVDFYKTYPGMYVPNPLKITVYEQDSSLESLCDEILGLTKMNWNNTQMDGRLPITLECARKIGDIMKYVSPTEKPQVSYSFYM